MTKTVEALRAGIRLTEGMRLASAGSNARLELDAGSLGLHAADSGQVRKAPGGGRIAYVLMQRDGNLVAYGENRRHIWASGTSGHPGSVALVTATGSLVVQAPGGAELWSSDDAADWRTVKTVDDTGYHYDATSDTWKQLCEALPCFAQLQWPGYETSIVERQINGQDVVVQLWKGRCQRFFGLDDFPGGIGAEVGVYVRKDQPLPRRLPFLEPAVEAAVLAELRLFAGHDLWWAAPELGTDLAFDLVNPITDEVIFSAGTEKTYWLNKWIYPEDYGAYGETQGPANMPQSSSHCTLRYSVNGEPQQQWPAAPSIAAGYRPGPLELTAGMARLGY